MNRRPVISDDEYWGILRQDLASFIHAAFYELNPQTRFIPGAHIELIANKLEACLRGDIRRLIINLPPRNLKSHCVSIAFPAWLLGHRPSARVICASYGQELADKLARDTRALMGSALYKNIFPTRLTDRQAVHDFETTEAGGRMATSVGGVLTGRGAEFIILDDPQKPDEALSETLRNGVNDWYQNTLLSRLNDKRTGCIILVMQRLHEDDLVGYVTSRDDWDILSFPAIAEADSTHVINGVLGRRTVSWREGGALHPDREDLETLNSIRRQIGEYNFSSQYQQRPVPPGGAIIKTAWLTYYELGAVPPRFLRIIQSWDTASKAGELNDYSVCTTWGTTGDGYYYLLDVCRRRLDFPDLKRAFLEMGWKWKPHSILVEEKASGIQLIQEMRGTKFHIVPYVPPPKADKQVRLHAQSIAFESGRVRLPVVAPWLADYVAELTGFPGSKFDDQVDSTTQFLEYMGSSTPPLIITPEMLQASRTRAPRPIRQFWYSGIPCYF